MDHQFTLEELKDWLGCSREAGKRVWIDSQFYVSMSKKAVKAARNHIGKRWYSLGRVIGDSPFVGETERDESRAEAKTEPVLNVYESAYDIVLGVSEHIKKNAKKYSFGNIGGFINLVKETAKWRLVDYIKKVFPLISLDEPLKIKKGNGEDEELSIGETILGQNGWQDEERFIKIEAAERLLNAFELYCGLGPALTTRLKLLRDLAGKEELEAVIHFTEENINKDYFLTQARENLKEKFNQNTWNSYNRRLRKEWHVFLETDKGSKLNKDFRECENG